MIFLGFKSSNPFRSHVPKGFYDDKKGHTGVDILMPVGTEVRFPVLTTIFDVRVQKEMGNTVYLRGPGGEIIVFAHLSAVYVAKGATVLPNTVFAHSGNTGEKTTAPHLHIEVIAREPTPGLEFMTRALGNAKGYNIDPEEYMNLLTMNSASEIAWLKEHGFINGDHKPSDLVTWSEFSVVLKRAVKKQEEWTIAKVMDKLEKEYPLLFNKVPDEQEN